MTNPIYAQQASPLWGTYYDACVTVDAYHECPEDPSNPQAAKRLRDAFAIRDSLEQLCSCCLEAHYTGIWDAPATWVCVNCQA